MRSSTSAENELDGKWEEPGSDELMDRKILERVKEEGEKAELERQRKIDRRGE
jgi:hypothetical protein